MDEPRTLLDAVSLVNVLVRFGLEMATLLAVAWSSWRLAPGPLTGAVMAVLAPVALALAWGAVVSPKAKVRLPAGGRSMVEVLVFGAGVAGLWWAGHTQASVALGTVAVLSLGITYTLGDPFQGAGGHGDG